MSLQRLKNYVKQFDLHGGMELTTLQAKFPKLRFVPYKTYGQIFNTDNQQAHVDYSMEVYDLAGTKATFHYRQYLKYHDCHSYLQI